MSNLSLPRFTGLYDKNGVPICAGDRVNFTVKGYPHERYPEEVTDAEVYYCAEDASFMFGRFSFNDDKLPNATWGYIILDGIDKATLEVISKK